MKFTVKESEMVRAVMGTNPHIVGFDLFIGALIQLQEEREYFRGKVDAYENHLKSGDQNENVR